jgi:hypothetical protein
MGCFSILRRFDDRGGFVKINNDSLYLLLEKVQYRFSGRLDGDPLYPVKRPDLVSFTLATHDWKCFFRNSLVAIDGCGHRRHSQTLIPSGMQI